MFPVNNRGAEMPCLMFWWGTFSDEPACPGCLAAAALKWLSHFVALTLSAPSGSWPPPAPATLPNVGTRSLVPVTSPSWLPGSLPQRAPGTEEHSLWEGSDACPASSSSGAEVPQICILLLYLFANTMPGGYYSAT